jgi:hypothetical protein
MIIMLFTAALLLLKYVRCSTHIPLTIAKRDVIVIATRLIFEKITLLMKKLMTKPKAIKDTMLRIK